MSSINSCIVHDDLSISNLRSSKRISAESYGYYDSAEDNDFDISYSKRSPASGANRADSTGSKAKKRKLSGDERLNRCRERNRIHARNTRERKKAQMDQLQQRVHELNDEVIYHDCQSLSTRTSTD
jgi:hypothetical protein